MHYSPSISRYIESRILNAQGCYDHSSDLQIGPTSPQPWPSGRPQELSCHAEAPGAKHPGDPAGEYRSGNQTSCTCSLLRSLWSSGLHRSRTG